MLQFDEYKVKLNNLAPALKDLAQALDLESAERELDMLQAESAADGFWDNLAKAQKVQQRIKNLQDKVDSQNRRQGQQGGKKPVGLLVRRLTFQDGIADGASHAQHQPAAVDQIEAGNGQVEGGQAGLAKPLGHKKGVGQDIAGDPHHSQHIQAGVPEKFAKQRGFRLGHTWYLAPCRKIKSARAFHLLRPNDGKSWRGMPYPAARQSDS